MDTMRMRAAGEPMPPSSIGGGSCSTQALTATPLSSEAIATKQLPSIAAHVRYSEADYWNERYRTLPSDFDWFYGYSALRYMLRFLRKEGLVRRDRRLLHIGCGTSNFQEGLARDGYTVINTDISEVVVEQMRARHSAVPNLSYIVSDCRSMPEFLDCQFGSVVDKGTVDALLCSPQASDNMHRMFSEISRVLTPGGTFLLITLGAPHQRLPLLTRPEYGWGVQVMLLPRAADDVARQGGAAAASARTTTIPPAANGGAGSCAADPAGRAQCEALPFVGPLQVDSAGNAVGLPQPFDPLAYFYAYACKKAPLVLPSASDAGGRVRLPDGWRATAQAMASALSEQRGMPGDLLSRGRRIRMVSRKAFAACLAQQQQAGDPGDGGAAGQDGPGGAAAGQGGGAPQAKGGCQEGAAGLEGAGDGAAWGGGSGAQGASGGDGSAAPERRTTAAHWDAAGQVAATAQLLAAAEPGHAPPPDAGAAG